MSTLTQAGMDLSDRHRRAGDETVQAAPGWGTLYRIGGACAAILGLIMVAQSAVFFAAPPPSSVADWFTLFHDSPLLGLMAFELLMAVYAILAIPLSLALYAALRRTDPSLMIVYVALGLIGSVAFVAGRPAFEMLYLSQQYAAATTDAQRAVYLTAGEGMVAVFHGTAFQVSYILGSLTGLIVSAVMLRSGRFGKTAAYLRIASSVFDFGLFVPGIGLFLSLISVFCLLGFNILMAVKLFRLAGEETADVS